MISLSRLQWSLLKAFCASLALAVFATGCGRGRQYVDPLVGPAYPIVYEQNYNLEDVVRESSAALGRTSDYRIGPGDVVSIQFLGASNPLTTGGPTTGETAPSNSVDYTVTDSPFLSLPLIGSIRVHGKSSDELQNDLKSAYGQFLRNPDPIVLIKEFNQNQIAVLGSVQTPARYPMEFGETLVDAIYKAGGLSMGGRSGGLAPGRYAIIFREKAGARNVEPLAEQLEDLRAGVAGETQRDSLRIPIQEFIFQGEPKYNVALQPNDIVYIPPAGTAMIAGRVEYPGATFLGPSVSTVGQVIVERGGMKYSADSDVEVVRLQSDGEPVSYFMDARDILSRKARDFEVRDGDQIFVYRHPVRSVLEFFGTFFRASAQTGVNATYNPAGGAG